MNHIPRMRSYVTGLLLSLLLTFVAFYFANYYLIHGETTLSNQTLAIITMTLAGVQFIVQSFFFFHLGQDKTKHYELVIFICTALCVAIIVLGSIWIMNNLNYHITQDPNIEQRILKDELLQKNNSPRQHHD